MLEHIPIIRRWEAEKNQAIRCKQPKDPEINPEEYFLAFKEFNPVGMMRLHPERSTAIYGGGNRIEGHYRGAAYVPVEHRGTGAWAALSRRIEEEARQRGMDNLMSYTPKEKVRDALIKQGYEFLGTADPEDPELHDMIDPKRDQLFLLVKRLKAEGKLPEKSPPRKEPQKTAPRLRLVSTKSAKLKQLNRRNRSGLRKRMR